MKKLKEKGVCLPSLSEIDLGEFDQYILSIESRLSKSIAVFRVIGFIQG